jgi:hypothetical protein
MMPFTVLEGVILLVCTIFNLTIKKQVVDTEAENEAKLILWYYIYIPFVIFSFSKQLLYLSDLLGFHFRVQGFIVFIYW